MTQFGIRATFTSHIYTNTSTQMLFSLQPFLAYDNYTDETISTLHKYRKIRIYREAAVAI